MMRHEVEENTPKKAANLSINKDLLLEARRLEINLSATLERALSTEVKIRQEQEWLKNNKAALEACNRLVDEKGLFSDAFRAF